MFSPITTQLKTKQQQALLQESEEVLYGLAQLFNNQNKYNKKKKKKAKAI